jgi:hypothetical protein
VLAAAAAAGMFPASWCGGSSSSVSSCLSAGCGRCAPRVLQLLLCWRQCTCRAATVGDWLLAVVSCGPAVCN